MPRLCQRCSSPFVPIRPNHVFCARRCATYTQPSKQPARVREYRLGRGEVELQLGRMARLRALARRYGVTLEDVQFVLALGRCDICGTFKCSTGRRFALDHDARTGRLRGALCGHCNHAIGKLRDDPARMRRAADYVESHRRAA
jgi:hypothetical protein